MNHKEERQRDIDAILNSTHDRRIVVAGPGTGKSFLFESAIKKARSEGKTRFLAITFIGKLGDALADDLAGLADTMTLHGFARRFVLAQWNGSEYYPRLKDVIEEDLRTIGKPCLIGEPDYRKRTEFYRAVGDDDVIFYALQICKKEPNKIPVFDLVLVDEFQDFNDQEAAFIDLLATKSKVLIVGDDDQALYEFKGSSPKFIRSKFDPANTQFDRHTLRFCSRCTEVIISAFHDVVDHFALNTEGSARIKKEYLCYVPDKKTDSDANPKILVSANAKPSTLPYFIKDQLADILTQQRVKSVLVLGEAQSCSSLLDRIARKLRSMGFRYVDHDRTESRPYRFEQSAVEALKLIAKTASSPLGWRLLADQLAEPDRTNLIRKECEGGEYLVTGLPETFKAQHLKNAAVLRKIIDGAPSTIAAVVQSSIEKLKIAVVKEETEARELFTNQLKIENQQLQRPLRNVDITVCSILGSKGLSADVVFLVGFDQAKLPAKATPAGSEIYQFLVALTRAKKRVYLINTVSCAMSQFLAAIEPGRCANL